LIITNEKAVRSGSSPENPTFAEGLILRLHLPYVVGCAFVGFVIFGFPVNLIVEYANTPDLSLVVPALFYPFPVGLLPLIALIVISLLSSYLFYATRYMRMRVLVAEQSLSKMISKQDFHQLFGTISSPRPQLVLFLAFFLFAGPLDQLATGRFLPAAYLVKDIAFTLIFSVGISSLIWTYFASLRGLYKIAGAPLKLSAHYEDSFLGLKPLGSFALSLAGSYFVFLALFLVIGSFLPSNVEGYTLISLLILLGVLMFFLPLHRLHRVMTEQKRVESQKLARQLAEKAQSPGGIGPTDVGSIMMLDMMERKVSAIHTWPFDLNILGKLTIIVLSVTAALLARLIAAGLGI